MPSVNDFEVVEYNGSAGGSVGGDPGYGNGGGNAGAGEAPAMSLARVHSVLRGRYRWAVGLFVLFAAAGGVAGYKATKPKYDSEAVIRIKSIIPKIIFNTENNNGANYQFESFLENQVAMVGGERTLSLAMQSPSWLALHRDVGPEGLDQFRQSLKITRLPKSEMVSIVFRDTDPDAALAAVRSMTEAFQKVYEDTEQGSGRARDNVLDELKTTLTAKLKSINEDIGAIYKELGTTDVAKMSDMKAEALIQAEAQLRQARIALAMADSSTTRPAAAAAAAARRAAGSQVDLLTLARADARVADLLRQKAQLDADLSQLKVRYGENNPQLQLKAAQLDDVNRRLDKLVEEDSASPELIQGLIQPNGAAAQQALANPSAIPVERLKQNVDNLDTLYKQAKLEAQQMADKAVQVRARREEADATAAKLKDVTNRIESLSVEASVGGRLSVVNSGERAVRPAQDKRTMYAVAGALFAGLFGAGLVFGRGLMDPRMRHIDDAAGPATFGAPRILGVVPTLFGSGDDAELTVNAAHAVHNIRVQLQMEVNPTTQRAIAVTSPSPGSGKTSLTMALGMSFAASGSRTLVIDCDLVGGGLSAMTRRMSRKRLGQILVRRGVVTREQLRELLDEALREGRRLGEVVKARGLADEATIEKMLAEQASSAAGLREALRGEPLAGCTVESGVPKLSVLPLGEATRQDAGRISPTDFRNLLARCKEEYDTVLIDTGPILGGLEAMIAASVADAAVVALAAGENRVLAQQAFESLHRARANIAGVIFNRASEYDLRRSVFSTSIARHSVARLPSPDGGAEASGQPSKMRPVLQSDGVEFGPIGSAVATSADVLGEEGT